MYSTLNDVIALSDEATIISLTDDEQLNPASIDPAVHTKILGRINSAISRADETINSYAGKQYSVPFSTPPALVVQLSSSLALYFLYLRRASVPDVVASAYKADIAALKDIASGAVSLGLDPAPASPAEAAEFFSPPATGRIFCNKGGML